MGWREYLCGWVLSALCQSIHVYIPRSWETWYACRRTSPEYNKIIFFAICPIGGKISLSSVYHCAVVFFPCSLPSFPVFLPLLFLLCFIFLALGKWMKPKTSPLHQKQEQWKDPVPNPQLSFHHLSLCWNGMEDRSCDTCGSSGPSTSLPYCI